MAASRAMWESGDPGARAALVQFANGEPASAGGIGLSVFTSTEREHPRKKHRAIVVAQAEHLYYVGQNFGVNTSRCNSLCRYYVGVLDKEDGKMRVYNAQHFMMQPNIQGEKEYEPKKKSEGSYRDKVDALIEAFGSHKQKRALSARRMNQVGGESLQKAVSTVAQQIIETRGSEFLTREVQRVEAFEQSTYLPPCNPKATSPDEAYKLNDIITEMELEAAEEASSKYLELMKSGTKSVTQDTTLSALAIGAIRVTPNDASIRKLRAGLVWYLDTLVHLFQLKKKKFSSRDTLGDHMPPLLRTKILECFTTVSFDNGRVQNAMTPALRDKIIAYVLVLALHLNSFSINLSLLQKDFKVSEKKILEVARALGLKIKQTRATSSTTEHKSRIAELAVPLTMPVASHERKRKR
ncbi:DNA-directed RNA polymerase I subunit RPA49 [Petromyzon marinus]|uniref:DNA-directed RNA polymerase I subunit RPA49 n=1 Tax=Petromyzon marinus TaxID=7757 RepID=A0AAJ7SWD9_PETMA|nr:DNA-directed RNA polymerase I subunit RPA49 [Petromyzon marinus]